MKKTAAILLLLIASIFADDLDCAIIVSEDQFGNRLPGYAILTKCKKDPFEVLQKWLDQNRPGENARTDYLITRHEGFVKFKKFDDH